MALLTQTSESTIKQNRLQELAKVRPTYYHHHHHHHHHHHQFLMPANWQWWIRMKGLQRTYYAYILDAHKHASIEQCIHTFTCVIHELLLQPEATFKKVLLSDKYKILFHFVFAKFIIKLAVYHNLKLLKHYSKAKHREPPYSWALHHIRGIVQRIVHGRFRSGCQRVRRAVKAYRCHLELE